MVAKKILIRSDASQTIGYGHVARCFILYKELKAQGHDVRFVTAWPFRNMEKMFEGYEAPHILNKPDVNLSISEDMQRMSEYIEHTPYDTLIVDRYDLGEQWQHLFYDRGIKVVVIDDLANQKHCCHMIVNPTFKLENDVYDGLVKQETKKLLGEKYILLGGDFVTQKKNITGTKNYQSPLIHVFFGSTDPNDYCFRYCQFLLKTFNHISLRVVHPEVESERWMHLKMQFQSRLDVHSFVKNMAKNMADCDLAFGAPGTATWERAALAIPSIYVSTNMNQIPILEKLAKHSFCYYLGNAEQIEDSPSHLSKQIQTIFSDPIDLNKRSMIGYESIDGLGASRVAESILEI